MSLTVISSGLFTTVQDLGRSGWRDIGVAAGGAMDTFALRTANLLVGNPEHAAGVELTLNGGELLAETDLLAAICGAYMAPQAAGAELPMWRPVWLARGTRLSLGHAAIGCAPVLGSRSTDVRAAIGGLAGRPLAAGDTLPCGAAGGAAAPSAWAAAWAAALAARARAEGRLPWAAASWFAPPFAYGGANSGGIVLRAMPGPGFGQLTAAAREMLFREPFRAAPASDRMGCRLSGPMLEMTARAELLSHGVTPGAVQLPPAGQPIVLAADCQTTGGYPVIAHVAAVDLPLLAQVKPGDYIRFQQVSLAEAQRLDLERESALRLLAAAIRIRNP